MCYSFRKIKNKQKSICTNAPNKYHLLRLIQIIIIKIIFSNFCFPICGSRCQNYVTMPAHLWWFLCGSTIFLCHLVKSNQWNNFQWTCCRLKQTEKQKSNEWSLMSELCFARARSITSTQSNENITKNKRKIWINE